MAYSKTYRIKNYLLNQIDKFEQNSQSDIQNKYRNKWNTDTNSYLQKAGYQLNQTGKNTCPTNIGDEEKGYVIILNNKDNYDYCIYKRTLEYTNDKNNKYKPYSEVISDRHTYMVMVYMKLDLPVIGQYIKIPITGETKQYTKYKY